MNLDDIEAKARAALADPDLEHWRPSVVCLELVAEIRRLRAALCNVFYAAVHDGRPCPHCLRPTSNVWPYCDHFTWCELRIEPATPNQGEKP